MIKAAKRRLISNTGSTGSLDRDGFLRAMLQLRNTLDPDRNISPAQNIFGHALRDTPKVDGSRRLTLRNRRFLLAYGHPVHRVTVHSTVFTPPSCHTSAINAQSPFIVEFALFYVTATVPGKALVSTYRA